MRFLRYGVILFAGAAAWAQNAAQTAPEGDRSAAYYNYTLAHMYATIAGESTDGGEYINQAISAYKAAIAADPRASTIVDELADFYIQFNRLQQARTEAEDAIQRNPNDVAAHRLLSRVYLRMIGGGQGKQPDPVAIRRATEEFQKVTELDPRDVTAWVVLGQLQAASGNLDGATKSLDKALAIDPDNEDALVSRAQVYSDRGDDKAAADMFERAAQKNPSAASWARLAGTYEQLKEYELAAEAVNKALALNPPNADELKKALASYLLSAGKYQEAADAFESIAADNPDDAEAWLRLSQLNIQLGNLPKAREAAEKAMSLEPDNLQISYNEASLLQAEGKPRDAIRALRSVIDKSARPNYSASQKAGRIDLLEKLAVMNRMLDQPTEAVAAYREIIALDNNTEAQYTAEIIDTYRGGKKLDEAQKEADAAVKKFPNDRGVRIARASLEADLGHADAAAGDVRKLLGSGGAEDRGIYLTLAELYEKGKKYEDAGKALDEAEKLSPDQDSKTSVWFMRGAMYEKMKNVQLAEGEFRKVLAVHPDHTATLNYLGYMLTDRNIRLNEALGMIEKAIAREPNNGAYLDSLGWAYFRLGRMAEAEEQIKKAVDLSPGDPTMHDHYADVLMQRKKVPEAVAAWEEALREWQASAPADKDATEIDKVRTKLENARKQLGR
jgi:tetratricopeptide (TPR) repeat protein